MDAEAEAGEDRAMILLPDAERLWRMALALNRAAAAVSPHVAALPPLLFFTDPERTPRPWETAARLPAGSGVVYRHFGDPAALEVATRLRHISEQTGTRLVIGADPDLADSVGADGVHLPQRALEQSVAIRHARPGWIITGAVHAEGHLAAMSMAALDACVVSPVFQAGGASGSKDPLGPDALRTTLARLGRPAYALGGITAGNAGGLKSSGACGLAGVDGIISAFGP